MKISPLPRSPFRWSRGAALAAALLSCAAVVHAAPPSLPEARLTRPDGSSLKRLFPGERVVQIRTAVLDPGPESLLKAVLWSVDVPGHKNRRLAEQQAKVPKPAKGNRTELVFTFTLPRDWPPGNYRVDVQLDSLPTVQRSFEARSSE